MSIEKSTEATTVLLMIIIYVYFIIPKIIRRVTQKVWENVN